MNETEEPKTMEIILRGIPNMEVGDSIGFVKGYKHFKLIRDE